MSCGSKNLVKNARVSCTNTDHDVTDLVNYAIVRNTKTQEQNITFTQNKKIINLCLR